MCQSISSWARSDMNGFTFVELLITITVAIIILTVGAINLIGFFNQQSLTREAQSLTALLITARERASGQDSQTRWGVFIQNNITSRDTYTLFEVDEVLLASSSYMGLPGTAAEIRTVRPNIEFANPLTGSSTPIVFQKITGLPTASTTIAFYNNAGGRLIFISSNGRIDYE